MCSYLVGTTYEHKKRILEILTPASLKKPNRVFIPIDIDECTTATHNCHGVAHCYNTEGSFNCECREGYSGDGILNCEPLGMAKKWTSLLGILTMWLWCISVKTNEKILQPISQSRPQRNETITSRLICSNSAMPQ